MVKMTKKQKGTNPFENKHGKVIILKKIFLWLSLVFGKFSWTPPKWIKTFGKQISNTRRKLVSWTRSHKKTAFGLIIGFICIIASVVTAYLWYLSRPLPVKFRFKITPPSVTKLEDVLKPDPVILNFNGSVARLEYVGKAVSEGISIAPEIKGEWVWADDSKLTFTPKEDWPVGQEYTVTADRSLFPSHIQLEQYTLKFKTAPFEAVISDFYFYEDPTDPKIKKVIATVKFSHPIKTEEFEKHISLHLQGKKKGVLGAVAKTYQFKVSYDKYNGEAYIHSESITIPENDSYMNLVISKGIQSSRGGPAAKNELNGQVRIPGIYNYFRIKTAKLSIVENERYEMEQVLIIESSTGVLESEIKKNLNVYVLPKDRPAFPGMEAIKDYFWHNVAEIGPEILEDSTALELIPIPTDREFATIHSYKYQAEVKRHLYIQIKKGTKSFGGYILARDFDIIREVPSFPEEVKILHEGSLLSMSGEKKVSILSRNLEAIRFEIGRVLTGQINHLMSQTSGKFSDPYFENYEFNQDNITNRFVEIRRLKSLPPGKTQYTALDFSKYIETAAGSPRGLFFLKVEGWNLEEKESTSSSDKRLILVTDLGMLVKSSANGDKDIFIQSITTGEPVYGAVVDIVGKNGLAVLTAKTDVNGYVKFPSLEDYEREKEPVVYVVRKGSDLSFLPYKRYDRNLSFSRFDTGGVYHALNYDGLNAYLFSDRGIYRPGDEFHVGIIVKSAKWNQELEGVPVEVVITDPRSLEIERRKFKLSSSGFEEISYKTMDSSPTGTYSIGLYIVKDNRRSGLLGSTTIRVEEFLPDRMKIKAQLSKFRQEGWVSPEGLTATVTLKNLFGTPAPNRYIFGTIDLSPSYPSFHSYRNYTFFDPFLAEKSFSEQLKEERTDENGEAVFSLGLDRFDKATYHLTFTAEGFESDGGRSVITSISQLVSPLDYIIGYKPDGDLRYIKEGSKRSVNLIAIDPQLKKIEVSELKVHIIEERQVSSLVRQTDGSYKYLSIVKEIPVYKKDISISKAGLQYELPTEEPGDFIIMIKDKNETELSKLHFSVIGPADLTRSLEKDTELQIKLNKTDFVPGEEIEMQIKSPYVGAGLITIECDRIYAYKWFKTFTTSSVQKIRLPKTLEGNGYVNVSFIRAIDSKEIFMSPLSYGVAAFSVNREGRTNQIDLDVPELSQPGEPFHIKYKSRDPGKIVIFAVDEGILQVANYKTPDPLSHFFKKRALQVSTSQILDLILPEISLVRELASPGGGYEEEAEIGKNLNPFKRKREKPVVYWSGIIDSDQSQREVIYHIPDYFNGTLRVMAVVVSPATMGTTQEKSIIRGPFVISPNVPMFIAPDDEFEISVSVANNIEGSGTDFDVLLELKTSDHLEILNEAKRRMKIAEGGEATEKFKIRACNVLGSGNLTFMASGQGKKIKSSIDLSVRPPVPYINTIVSGYFKDDKVEVPVKRKMYPHFRKLNATASTVPLGVAHGLIGYLEKFPYGCTEQLVSKAFPALILKKHKEFGYSPEKIDTNLNLAIRILRARQNAEGAFGFWAASSHVSDFQTVYALHFLTEAKEKDYPIPQDVLQKGLSYLKNLLNEDITSLAKARVHSYSIYILTRNGMITTNYLNSLVEKLEKNYTSSWEKDLTGIYVAATYEMHKHNIEAIKLIRKSKPGDEQKVDYSHFYDRLVRDSQYIYILARHFPELLRDLKGDDILSIINPIINGRYNTTSSAYAILALDAYVESVGEPKEIKLTIREKLAGKKPVALSIPAGLFPIVSFSEEAENIIFESDGNINIFYQVIQSGFDLTLPEKEIKERLEVQREYRDKLGNVITKTTLGSEIEVHIKVRALDKNKLENIAIVDLLPGGFEVEFENGRRDNQSSWSIDYIDIREDRVILYGSIGAEVKEYVYRIKAINKGKYKVPPIFGESMYDRSVQARALGGEFIIE